MDSTVSIMEIRKTISELVPHTDGSRGLKVALHIFINDEPEPPNEEYINGLKEDLTV